MSHQCRNSYAVNSPHQGVRRKRVSQSVEAVFHTHELSNPLKSTIRRRRRPRTSFSISKQRTKQIFLHKTLGDIHGFWRQVNDTRNFPSLRFGARKYPALTDEVNMSSLNAQRLLRPAAGFPSDREKVPKFLVCRAVKQCLIFGRRDDLLLAPAAWLSHVSQWRPFDITLLFSPLHCALDRSNQIAARTRRQTRLRIYPLLHVMRFELIRAKCDIDSFAEGINPDYSAVS